MKPKITRKEFIQFMGLALGSASVALLKWVNSSTKVLAQTISHPVDLPLVMKQDNPTATHTPITPTVTPTGTASPTATETGVLTPTITSTPHPSNSRVVRVHSASATDYAGSGYFWEHISQSAVNNMVNQGLQALTGTASVADAWHVILPNYQTSQIIAIKVNFNNCESCSEQDNQIDATIEPVNAIVSGLEATFTGFNRANVWVYDAIRPLPNRFANAGLAGITFYNSCSGPSANFDSSRTDNRIEFTQGGVPEEILPDLLLSADYLIDISILKAHPLGGVSLGYKNHFGTIQSPGAIHSYITPDPDATYNPLVDFYRNQHIGGKTVLTIGDGIFGGIQFNQPPSVWETFDYQYPKSLFFSRDTVAIDCVMHDFVKAEPPCSVPAGANRYLQLAASAGQGTFESIDPWSQAYTLIDYQYIEL